MPTAQANLLLQHVRGLVVAQATDKLLDRQLLERFTERGEEAAFAALVRRHGPLVLGVCRRVLHDWHDAEDAFQATFLVLARKAGSIAKSEALGSWLYKVAYRVAVRARGQAALRHARERQAGPRMQADPLAEVTGRELLTVLDEELHRLPERYRAPLVLYYLQGQARDRVARQLGWSLRTVCRRLAQGRECLRARLKRRHFELPAALLLAGLAHGAARALPGPLATVTVRSAAEAGIAAASGVALRLAAGTLAAMTLQKIKTVAAVALAAMLLVAAGWLVYRGTPLNAADTEKQPAVNEGRKSAPVPATNPARHVKADQAMRLAIFGRVLDAAGKPAGGARVAVLARQGVRLSSWENWAWFRNQVLGQTTADAHGRYRLDVPRPTAGTFRQVRVVAAGTGHGLSWTAVDPTTRQARADIRLAPPQFVRGRLVDLQGEPAAGVNVHVVRVERQPNSQKADDWLPVPAGGLPAGIATATSDARGRFTLAGFGPGLKIELEVRDDRYAPQVDIHIDTADRKQAENYRLVLPPPRTVEGRVTYSDTGKPAAGARVVLDTYGSGSVSAETDAAGRYRVNILPASKRFADRRVSVGAFPPPGTPYLSAWQVLAWPDGAVVRQSVDLALPRGVVLHGKITEAGTGRPVPGAFLAYNNRWRERGAARPDGTYRIVVPSGKGRLLVDCSRPDYIPQVVGTADGVPGKPVGEPVYHHAVAELDIRPGEKTREVPITLHRGVTIQGRLVGPDGKPVPSALMFVAGHRPPHEKTMHPIYVRGGRFEIPGCDPAKTYRVTFLEHSHPVRLMMGIESIKSQGQLWLPELLGNKGRLGGVAQIAAAKGAAKPVEVRLAPCGSARLRFRDAAGKPVAGYTPWLQLVVAPGPTIYDALEQKTLAAEVITLVGRHGEANDPHTDARGRLVYDGLIPGVIYRVKKTRQEPRNEALKDFTVEAGKTAEVEIVMK